LASAVGAGDVAKNDPFTEGLRKGDPYQLYLLLNKKIDAKIETAPFGMPVKTVDFCDEWFTFRRDEYEVAQLIALFRRAHAMCSADRGLLVMPRWLMVDLILMPSAAMLILAGQAHLTQAARKLEHDLKHRDSAYHRSRAASIRDLLRIAADSHYEGPIPVAAYSALPTLAPHRWIGGSIWWSLLPDEHLGYAVRRIALQCFGAQKEVGVAQFSNRRALRVQRRFGQLCVVRTTLDVHPLPHTFVYEVDLTALPPDGSPARPQVDIPAPHRINLDDPEIDRRLTEIQRDIDAGVRYCVVSDWPDEGCQGPVLYQDGRRPPLAPVPSARPARGRKNAAFFTRGIDAGRPYQLYMVSNEHVLKGLDLNPFGIAVKTIDFWADDFAYRGRNYSVAQLLDLFRDANSLSFEEGGLGIPPWAMAELILMPSAVLLVLASQEHLRRVATRLEAEPVTNLRQTRLIPLDESDRDRLHYSNSLGELLRAARERRYSGPLPIAGYAGAPTRRDGYWVGWSMWSLVPGEQLGYTVKRIALQCYGAQMEAAVAQFGMARGLDVNAKFGWLPVIQPYVPAHPAPGAFAYEIDVRRLPGDGSPLREKGKIRWIKEFDPEATEIRARQQHMRHEMKRGARYYVLSRGDETKSPLVPIGRRFGVHKRMLGWALDKMPERAHPVRKRRWPA
jgi:hypothetical protein